MTRGEYCKSKGVKCFDIDLSIELDKGFKEFIDWICDIDDETIDKLEEEDSI